MRTNSTHSNHFSDLFCTKFLSALHAQYRTIHTTPHCSTSYLAIPFHTTHDHATLYHIEQHHAVPRHIITCCTVWYCLIPNHATRHRTINRATSYATTCSVVPCRVVLGQTTQIASRAIRSIRSHCAFASLKDPLAAVAVRGDGADARGLALRQAHSHSPSTHSHLLPPRLPLAFPASLLPTCVTFLLSLLQAQ